MVESAVSSSPFSYKSIFTYDSDDDYIMKKYKSENHFKSIYGYTYHSLPLASDSTEGESWPSKVSRVTIICICYAIVLALFPLSFWICLKKINSLERLVVLRLGKLQPVVGPGYSIVFPLIDKWSRVDLRPKTYLVPTQQVLTADGAIIELSSSVTYCVSHAVYYVTKLHSQEQSIQELVQRYLTNLISEKEQTVLERNRDFISSSIKMELNKTVECWGLEILSVVLPPVKVLKEAEPVNTLGKVFDALKAVATTYNSSVPFAGQNETYEKEHKEQPCKLVTTSWESSESDKDLLKRVINLMEAAAAKNLLSGVSANYKLKIIGGKPSVILIFVSDGSVSVVEGNDDFINQDVTIILTEEDIQDFFSLKSSPVQAYFEGKIQVIGNWSLLKNLAEVFI